jgi:hypothetical protein
VELFLLFLLTCVIATSASTLQVEKYGPAEPTRFELEGSAADASVSKISLLASSSQVLGKDRPVEKTKFELKGGVADASASKMKSLLVTTGCVDQNTYGDGSCCTGDIEISSTAVTIGSRAFHGCDGLTGIIIPSSVTSIGSYAFWLCRGLTTLQVSSLWR